MQFQREQFNAVLAEIKPLLELHWQEIASHKDLFDLKPDWTKYAAIDRAGKLAIYTARENGILLGYSIYFVDAHLHYMDMIVAKNDITFLLPEARKGFIGYKLLKFAVTELSANVDRILFNMKVYKDFGAVLEKLGFKQFEIVFDKVVTHGI